MVCHWIGTRAAIVDKLHACRVASRHFSQVQADNSNGLLTTIAGIQDLNILFSNVAFVAVLRAFVQVMEAGIKDPDLVVWLQARTSIFWHRSKLIVHLECSFNHRIGALSILQDVSRCATMVGRNQIRIDICSQSHMYAVFRRSSSAAAFHSPAAAARAKAQRQQTPGPGPSISTAIARHAVCEQHSRATVSRARRLEFGHTWRRCATCHLAIVVTAQGAACAASLPQAVCIAARRAPRTCASDAHLARRFCAGSRAAAS